MHHGGVHGSTPPTHSGLRGSIASAGPPSALTLQGSPRHATTTTPRSAASPLTPRGHNVSLSRGAERGDALEMAEFAQDASHSEYRQLGPAGLGPQQRHGGSAVVAMENASLLKAGTLPEVEKIVDVGPAPTPCLRLAIEQPGRAYCCACASFCSFFFIMILVASSVSGFFEYQTTVPLYLRSHITKRREDAITEGIETADYTIGRPKTQLQRASDEMPDSGDRLVLKLIYLPKDGGDAFTTEVLQDIRKLEQGIMQISGYTDHCLVDYTAAERQMQEDAVTSGNYDEVEKLNQKIINGQQVRCAPPWTVTWACTPQPGAPCSSVSSSPVGVLDCARTDGQPCDAFATEGTNAMVLESGFKENKVAAYANTPPVYRCPGNNRTCDGLKASNFLMLIDSEFGASRKLARALRAEFSFGLPIPGYPSIYEDEAKQGEVLETWIFDTYDSWLREQGTPRLDVVWTGYGMFGKYLNSIVQKDGSFALGSMVFVLIYIAFMTGSWWLAVMGMGGILMSFPPAYFLYYGVFQQRYFGVFNVLTVFIILGIGADDIFVILDTWDRSASELGEGATVRDRLVWTWKHAAKAMLLTSLTTMISFLATASSSFPAIRTFGIFAAMLVFVNYCGVIFYFPTVITTYELWHRSRAFCCGVPNAITSKINSGLGLDRPNLRDFKFKVVDGQEVLVWSPSGEGKANRWFRESFAPMVMGMNTVIIVTFLVLLGIMIAQVKDLTADPEPPKLLPADNNYQRYADIAPTYFSRGGSDRSEVVQFVWGINKDDPIDRAGTLDTDIDNLGKPVWDTNFNLGVAAECLYQICTAAQVKSDLRKTSPDFPIKCWVLDFKQWVLSGPDGEKRWANSTGRNARDEVFFPLLIQWFADPLVVEKWKPYIFAQEVEGEPWLRFTMAEITLTVNDGIDPADGIAVFNTWEKWMADQYEIGPDDGYSCKSVKDEAMGWQVSMSYAFVRDKLTSEAFSGIFLSVLLAFFVLCLFTGNVVVALYATAVIVFIVICAIGCTVIMGWKLGILESVSFVMVPGMSVDFVAHMAEGYLESHSAARGDRVRDMFGNVGISVVSGAFSTLGATLFLFLPTVVFFNKFGTMIFLTIGLSLLWSLLFFPALLSTPLGPEGTFGDWHGPARRALAKLRGR
eukprot:TRINITY_DN51049_c0_g1_i1.p1 TRINITY_DN51049_c0_g1~~TRINITY_DN51049_c0_g1_i1.p1  ORF type:complete len:1177 (+),score=340.80 TRINITY_DN51049_c0_g1_i1:105-3533(+)